MVCVWAGGVIDTCMVCWFPRCLFAAFFKSNCFNLFNRVLHLGIATYNNGHINIQNCGIIFTLLPILDSTDSSDSSEDDVACDAAPQDASKSDETPDLEVCRLPST